MFFVNTRAVPAVDAVYSNKLVYLVEDGNIDDYSHYITKRRFLPTRRELNQYVNDDFSNENDEETENLNRKRYFLKSKRYFLHSKREYE